MKRVLLTGGGTGGHIYPALAIAKELKRRYPNISIAYIGTKSGLESKILSNEKWINFYTIDIQGFKRKLSWKNVQTIYKFLQAVRISKSIIRDFQPEVVVGTGGYVSGPPVYSAYRLQVPTLIHEQNVIPGLTTRFLSRFASSVALSFEQSAIHFRKSTSLFCPGNPRATEVAKAKSLQGRESLRIQGADKKIVLIVGGSQGARVINQALLNMLPYLGQLPEAHFVYITGQAHYEEVLQKINTKNYSNLEIHPFLYNLPDVLAASHIVVSRAGATTLSEITSLGIPSILIPSPYVTNNHQVRNAQWLQANGACILMEEKNCTQKALWEAIVELTKNNQLHQKMSHSSLALGFPNAAETIVNELEKLSRLGIGT